MANFYDGFNVRPVTLWLQVTQTSQNVGANTSSISWALRLRKDGNTAPYNNDTSPWSVTINGVTTSGNSTYDLSGVAVGGTDIIASGARVIAHNSDGSKTISVSASFNDSADQLDVASLSGSMALTTIPRASEPTVTDSDIYIRDGSTTIQTHRASASFTHTITYKMGSATGTIATKTSVADVSWTPNISMASALPSSTSGTCIITVETFSGSTSLGTNTTSLTLRVPTDIVPNFTTVTGSEAVSSVAAVVGAGVFVQNQSKITATITGATSQYGASPSVYKITLAGQTINAVSGTTPSVISSSGTVPMVGTVTDTRGRSVTKTANATVLAWTAPAVSSLTVRRATAGGVIDPNGTSIKLDFVSSVQSLVNSVEKNTLTYTVYVRERGTSSWGTAVAGPTVATTTTSGGRLNFTGSLLLAGTRAIDKSWEVQVKIQDKFANTAPVGTVATSAIDMHYDANVGVGVGKYRENGRLDVNGDTYTTKLRITATGDLSPTSTGHGFQVGPDTGLNVGIDQNEIMGRNNGVAAYIAINSDGGNVNIGNDTSTVSVPGLFNNPNLPIRMAAGQASVTPSAANTNTSVVVTLPTSRFTVPPLVTLGNRAGSSTTGLEYQYWLTTTATQLTITVRRSNTSVCQLDWIAIQMGSSAAG